MSKEQYCKLIDQFAELQQVDPKSMYEVCNTRVSEVEITVTYGGSDDPNGILIYADYGVPPKSAKETVVQRLMELNFFILNNRSARFGIDTESGRVVLMNRINISSTSIETFVFLLNELSAYVKTTSHGLYRAISNIETKLAEAS